jgi:hypothetical protein
VNVPTAEAGEDPFNTNYYSRDTRRNLKKMTYVTLGGDNTEEEVRAYISARNGVIETWEETKEEALAIADGLGEAQAARCVGASERSVRAKRSEARVQKTIKAAAAAETVYRVERKEERGTPRDTAAMDAGCDPPTPPRAHAPSPCANPAPFLCRYMGHYEGDKGTTQARVMFPEDIQARADAVKPGSPGNKGVFATGPSHFDPTGLRTAMQTNWEALDAALEMRRPSQLVRNEWEYRQDAVLADLKEKGLPPQAGSPTPFSMPRKARVASW